MKFDTIKVVLLSVAVFVALWVTFWFAGAYLVKLGHPEAAAFVAPGEPGTAKTIDTALLNRYHGAREVMTILTCVAALVISQTSMLVSAIRNR